MVYLDLLMEVGDEVRRLALALLSFADSIQIVRRVKLEFADVEEFLVKRQCWTSAAGVLSTAVHTPTVDSFAARDSPEAHNILYQCNDLLVTD